MINNAQISQESPNMHLKIIFLEFIGKTELISYIHNVARFLRYILQYIKMINLIVNLQNSICNDTNTIHSGIDSKFVRNVAMYNTANEK